MSNITAADVRSYFRANPEGLSETVTRNVQGRGRLHPDTREAFAAATGQEAPANGQGKPAAKVTLPLTKMNKRGARIKRPETFSASEVRTLAGVPTDKRGRLSAEVIAKATEAVMASRGWDSKPE